MIYIILNIAFELAFESHNIWQTGRHPRNIMERTYTDSTVQSDREVQSNSSLNMVALVAAS